MNVAQINHKANIPEYVAGLLATDKQKVCTSIAESLNVSHDSIYYQFNDQVQKPKEVVQKLYDIAISVIPKDSRYLLFDDTIANKQYAKEIEGLDVCFDSSEKRAVAGLQSVNAVITNGDIKIPINAELSISKQFGGGSHTTKSQIAITMAKDIFDCMSITRIIADAHYSTQYFIHDLHDLKAHYLMKIARNRVVKIGDKTGQLKNILRLKRNSKVASTPGFFGDIPCYFHVVKNDVGKTVYLISDDWINRKEIKKLYRIRWSIECFHRTAKRLLGFSDCQMRAFEKQHLHILYVMFAYALAEIERIKYGLSTTEDAIRSLRIVKSTSRHASLYAVGQNLC